MRQACRDHGEDDPLDEAATRWLTYRGLDGVRLWVEPGAGFALVRDGQLDLAVAPHHRERGLGTDLAVAAVTAATVTRGWAHGDHPAAGRLAGRLGFERIRELWVLRRSTSAPLPPLDAQAGVTITPYDARDRADLIAVNAAAFAAHPEQAGMDEADLTQRMAEPWFDPAGLLIARDPDGPMLGFHWTKLHSPDLGEVYVVGVSPAAQGRGLGRLLTLAGLHHLTDRGVAEIHLYVEADNVAALRLYQSLGFTHAGRDTHVMYTLPG